MRSQAQGNRFAPGAVVAPHCAARVHLQGLAAEPHVLVKRYPFVDSAGALALLRVVVAVLFMAHAVVRIANGSIPQFAGFLAREGWPFALELVWTVTVAEILCGCLLIAGRWVRWATAPLALIAAMGIVIIHGSRGWFVGEHGTGGMEYSVALLAALCVVAAADGADRVVA